MLGSGKGSVTHDQATGHGEVALIPCAHYHQRNSLQYSTPADGCRTIGMHTPPDMDRAG